MVNGRRIEVSDVESEETDKWWWRQKRKEHAKGEPKRKARFGHHQNFEEH